MSGLGATSEKASLRILSIGACLTLLGFLTMCVPVSIIWGQSKLVLGLSVIFF